MSEITNCRKANKALTERVTELHNLGYDHDFVLSADSSLLCLQSRLLYLKQAASIRLVDQVYDYFCCRFQYIYTVEPETGERGIMLLNHIAFNAIVN